MKTASEVEYIDKKMKIYYILQKRKKERKKERKKQTNKQTNKNWNGRKKQRNNYINEKKKK